MGEGLFTDSHPWLFAEDLFNTANEDGTTTSILFADNEPLIFTHWAFIRSLTVEEFRGDRYETRIRIGRLNVINPIWESIDSVLLRPSAELLHRERLEPIRILRTHLNATHLRPYAICETPAFIFESGDHSLRDQ